MPLPAEQLEGLLARAAAEDRLAHAYLLTGDDLTELEHIFFRIASRLLGVSASVHPDLHLVKPESKSRRITVGQIRGLERELYLKAFSAPVKVAGVFSADRMCLGQAEAANAFLKTLEEPPDHSVIFLTTTAPDLLLPTIKSRCVAVPFRASKPPSDPLPSGWLDRWLVPEKTADLTAYRRASLLAKLWAAKRVEAETSAKAGATNEEEEEEEVFEARVEAEFLWRRDEVLRAIARGVWEQRSRLGIAEAARTVEALEELRYALSRNIEAGLATERACLAMMRVIR